jgi:hypothetical protein
MFPFGTRHTPPSRLPRPIPPFLGETTKSYLYRLAVVNIGLSVRQAGWDQVMTRPNTWPPDDQIVTVTLTIDQWGLAASSLDIWVSITEDSHAPEGVEPHTRRGPMDDLVRHYRGRHPLLPRTGPANCPAGGRLQILNAPFPPFARHILPVCVRVRRIQKLLEDIETAATIAFMTCEKAGATTASSASASTDLLITGAGKLTKAEKLGITIVDQSEIWQQLLWRPSSATVSNGAGGDGLTWGRAAGSRDRGGAGPIPRW